MSGPLAGSGAQNLACVLEQLDRCKNLPSPPPTNVGRARLLLFLTKLFFVATLLIVPLVVAFFSAVPVLSRVFFGFNLPTFANQVFLLAAIGTVTAFLASFKKRRGAENPRIVLARKGHEELFGLVDAIASRLRTRPPDEIMFSETPGFAVLEEGTGWFGTKRRRTLFIEATGLARLSIPEFASTIVHEMAHFSERHTSYEFKLHRTFVKLQRFSANLRGKLLWFLNPIHHLTALFFRVYVRLYYPISRSFEMQADAMAIRLLGKDPFARGLEKELVAGVKVAFRFRRLIDRAIQSEVGEENLFELLRSDARDDELRTREESFTEREVERASGPYSTHPSFRERIEHAQDVAVHTRAAEPVIECAGEFVDAMDFFLGQTRKDLEVRLSRLLIDEAEIILADTVGLRGIEGSSQQRSAADKTIISIKKTSTEKWLLTLLVASTALGTVMALCVFAWADDTLQNARWELTLSIPLAILFFAWALRSRREAVIADGAGIIQVGAFRERLIPWERIEAVRTGIFSNKIFGEWKGKRVKIAFDGRDDENRLMVRSTPFSNTRRLSPPLPGGSVFRASRNRRPRLPCLGRRRSTTRTVKSRSKDRGKVSSDSNPNGPSTSKLPNR